jgi:prefoldin subunit 5
MDEGTKKIFEKTVKRLNKEKATLEQRIEEIETILNKLED